MIKNGKNKIQGGMLAFIGYLLSPLSWWNDAFINLPLAFVFGWIISLFYPKAFEASVILGYWLTNVLGLVLMHKGLRTFQGKNQFSKRELLKDLGISLLYTALIYLLIRLRILMPLPEYFRK